MSQFVQKYRWNTWPDTKHHRLDVTRHLADLKCTRCDKGVDDLPFITPPTWAKVQFHSTLRAVWQRAAQELETAEHVVVSGYSYPPTDEFFKYLYAVSAYRFLGLKKFRVFDPDPQVESRFAQMLGDMTRGKFVFQKDDFAHAIAWMYQAYVREHR